MRLKLVFGIRSTKYVDWYQDIKNLPTMVNHLSDNWEFVIYDRDPSNAVDYICNYSEIQYYDLRFGAQAPSVETFFIQANTGLDGCVCGARHTSFAQLHMLYCPKWTDIMGKDKEKK